MSTQKKMVTAMKNNKGKTIRIKKYSESCLDAKQIYDALNYKMVTYYMKKSVVLEN